MYWLVIDQWLVFWFLPDQVIMYFDVLNVIGSWSFLDWSIDWSSIGYWSVIGFWFLLICAFSSTYCRLLKLRRIDSSSFMHLICIDWLLISDWFLIFTWSSSYCVFWCCTCIGSWSFIDWSIDWSLIGYWLVIGFWF